MILLVLAASITALAAGLGVLPLRWTRNIVPAHGEAFAAGLMLAASGLLFYEGYEISALYTLLGAVAGAIFVELNWRWLHGREDDLAIGALTKANARRAILIVGVMTVHSMAEGVGIGVSWADGYELGALVVVAMTIHNIPEGLAIGLVLVPRGVSLTKSFWLAVLSSAPQPLLAIPAFVLAQAFAPILPIGLGFAGGAMVWLCLREMMPESYAEIGRRKANRSAVLGLLVMAVLVVVISLL